MGKIAIVGCEASGKTVFMSALTDCYRPGAAARPCLVPENSEANHFAELGRRQMRALRQWPPATHPGKTVEMKWTLRSDAKVLAEIGMLEFGGETFRAAFRGDDEPDRRLAATQSLLDYLAEAEAVILLISLKELLRDPAGRSAEDFERATESIWVSRGLLEFVRRHLPRAAVVIGLTQSDRYPEALAEFKDARTLLAAKWPTVGAITGSIPVIPVASVSAVDKEGRPAPDYTTDGIEPIMQEVFRQLDARKCSRIRPYLLLALAAAAGTAWFCLRPVPTDTSATVPEPEPPAAPALPPDLAVFSNRYERALAGDTESRRWIGTRLFKGSASVAADPVEARRFFRLAAEAGDLRSEVHLAVMCEQGLGGPADAAEAEAWFRKAADAGHPDALYRIAVDRWTRGADDPAAVAEAHALFLRARESGCRIPNLDAWIKRTAPKSDSASKP